MFGVMRIDGMVHENLGVYPDDSVDNYRFRLSLDSNVAVPKDYINYWKSGHKCEKEGCLKDGGVECHIPEATEDLDNPKNLIEHFCHDHAYESGYCTICGDFWGGIDSFDFNNPERICDNCREQIDIIFSFFGENIIMIFLLQRGAQV